MQKKLFTASGMLHRAITLNVKHKSLLVFEGYIKMFGINRNATSHFKQTLAHLTNAQKAVTNKCIFKDDYYKKKKNDLDNNIISKTGIYCL